MNYNTEWSRKNVTKVKANHVKYLAKPDKALANKEYKKRWSEENRERLKQNLIQKTQNPVEHVRRSLVRIKGKSKKKNIPFDITTDDIIIPEFCPIFKKVQLTFGLGMKLRESSATIDKIIPELGYVRGNVQIICYKANRMKNNGTLEELVELGKWAESCVI